MLEIVIDKRGEIAIDNLEWLMDQFPGHARRAIASALKSEGFRLAQIIKMVIAGKGVDGTWPDLNPHTGVLSRKIGKGGKSQWVKNYRMVWRGERGKKYRVREYKSQILSSRKAPQAKIKNAIGYTYDEDTNSVDVSFQNGIFRTKRDRLRFLMHLQSEGYSKVITPKMRKMLFALGFPVKKETTHLKTPKRESIQPVFEQQKHTIVKNLDAKFQSALDRYIFRGARRI
jgi:hypothetical protein